MVYTTDNKLAPIKAFAPAFPQLRFQNPFSKIHADCDICNEDLSMNPKVDAYISKTEKWQDEVAALRDIILDCGLEEKLKWSLPCYTYLGSNVVIINPLKNYCALGFFKGSLLQDEEGILSEISENVQGVRLIRFTGISEIVRLSAILRSYIYEAIEVERAGLKVIVKKKPLPIPEEFQKRLNRNASLKKAFDKLTPGRQRGYLLYFTAAKQSKTRESRIDKCFRQILEGRGLND